MKKFLIRGVLINLVSQGWLLLLVFFFTPFILKTLGKELFGVFALSTSLFRYAGVFDLGLKQATVKHIAEHDGKKQYREINRVATVTFLLFVILALANASAVFLLGNFLVYKVFNIAAASQAIALRVFQITALNIFLHFLTEHAAAIAHGKQRFAVFNIKTWIVGTVSIAGIAIALWQGKSLTYGLLLVSLSQIVTLVSVWFLNMKLLSVRPFFTFSFDKKLITKLFDFGIFKFASNLGGELVAQTGNFIIGSFLLARYIPLFAIPHSLTQKASIIIAQIVTTIFPFAAYLEGKKAKRYIIALSAKGQFFNAGIALIIAGGLFFLGESFLAWWLNDPAFAQQAALPLKILAVAYFLKSFSAIPGAITDGLGKTKITAFFSLGNGVLTLLFTLVFVPQFQFAGAALAVFTSTLITFPTFLYFFYTRVLPKSHTV